MVSVDAEFPKTHDLERLLALCAERDTAFQALEEQAGMLNGYAVGPRYVDDWREIDPAEAAEAIAAARRIMEFALARLPRTA